MRNASEIKSRRWRSRSLPIPTATRLYANKAVSSSAGAGFREGGDTSK